MHDKFESDHIEPKETKVDLSALQRNIRLALQKQSSRDRSSSVELTKSSTKSLLADAPRTNARKAKTGPARH
jgi:hypothetical protein